MSDDPADEARATFESGATAARQAGETASAMSGAAVKEFTRMFSEMKMPTMPDMEALLSAHRRNLETLSAANRVALEGAQAVARRNMEIMQQTMAELSDSMRAFSTGGPPQTQAARQTDMLKSAYERAIANMQEIGGLIQKSNGEALGLLNTRFTEALDEVKLLVDKGASQT